MPVSHALVVGFVKIRDIHIPAEIAVAGIGEPLAVRRKGGENIFADGIGEPLQARAVSVDDINFIIAAFIETERDALAVRRPHRIAVVSRIVGQSARIAAVGVHHVNVVIPVAVRREGDLRPVRRPCGIFVRRRVIGQLRQFRAIHVHDVNLEIAVAVRLKEDFPRCARQRRNARRRRLGGLWRLLPAGGQRERAERVTYHQEWLSFHKCSLRSTHSPLGRGKGWVRSLKPPAAHPPLAPPKRGIRGRFVESSA